MPPKIRFAKEDVVKAAYEVAREKGLDAVNARSVAAQIGCSTQPLFREFSCMEDIKNEVFQYTLKRFEQETLEEQEKDPNSLRAAGRIYLRMAKNEPNLFRMLFMRKRCEECANFAIARACEKAVTLGVEMNVEQKEAKGLYITFWMFVHGMATMFATEYLTLSDEAVENLLEDLVSGRPVEFP